MSQLIYLAGPYRGDVRSNVARAVWHGQRMMSRGDHILVPHLMSRDLDPFNRMGDDYWLAVTLNAMERCDAVALLPGWRDSAGSVAEAARARELGLEVWEVAE